LAIIYSAKYLVPIAAPPIDGGALLTENGKITAVGTVADLKRCNPAAEVVDFEQSVILPLLVNAHTHLELTDFPAWAVAAGETAEPDSFTEWILRLIRVKRSLGKKDYQQSVSHGIARALASGTGVVGDVISQYFCRKAYRDTGLHGVLYLESLGHDPAIIRKVRSELMGILAEEKVGDAQLGLSPHSPYTISSDYLAEIYEKCQRQNLPCMTHLSESEEEVAFIERGQGALATDFYAKVGWSYLLPKPTGQRPTEYLLKQGGLFPDNLLVHGVQLSSQEIELIAANRMHLALCPRSNSRLKVGKAPVGKLLTAGVNLCLGTDSMASNDSLSLWDEIAFASRWFEGEVDARALMHLATLGGSQALGLSDSFGSLSVGKYASFQVLNLTSTTAVTELFDYLVAPGRTADIHKIYQRGRELSTNLN